MTVSVYDRHFPTYATVTFRKVRLKSNFVQVRMEYEESKCVIMWKR